MVPEIRKILFTSDLTETSKHAFKYALSLSLHFKAQMVFLFVMEGINETVRAFLGANEAFQQTRNRSADEARAVLIGKRREIAAVRSGIKQFYDTALKGLCNEGEAITDSEVIVTEGNVVDTIIQTALEKRCDAVVLGSRRCNAFQEAMFGSVVKGVLKRSKQLVIIAPPIPEII